MLQEEVVRKLRAIVGEEHFRDD